MPRPPSEGGANERLSFDFDAEHILERDPYVLLDPRLLGPLLTQLAEELGPDRAGVAVTQIGALLGLRDARQAMGLASSQRSERPDPIATPLRMRCLQRRDREGRLEIRGEWPDRNEAAARLAGTGKSPTGGCQISLGYTSGWLSGLYERDLLALEVECGVAGHESCEFVARGFEDWSAHASPEEWMLLEALRLPELREILAERPTPAPAAHPAEGDDALENVDRDACAIHIWGPVMVIPYAGPDEALAALELIGRDPTARGVSVVVLDLEGTIVDEAHGALSLEHIVHAVEAWGAETIFTEPSPLSAQVLSELENAPLLVVKDLDEAIAVAFQVAESQRREL
jgi:hypothetical protein